MYVQSHWAEPCVLNCKMYKHFMTTILQLCIIYNHIHVLLLVYTNILAWHYNILGVPLQMLGSASDDHSYVTIHTAHDLQCVVGL